MTPQYITLEDIKAVGIKIPEGQEDTFVQHTNETLQERIGTEITTSLTDEQIDQMLAVQEDADDEHLQAWLLENVPELDDIVKDEVDILLGELVESTETLNS